MIMNDGAIYCFMKDEKVDSYLFEPNQTIVLDDVVHFLVIYAI